MAVDLLRLLQRTRVDELLLLLLLILRREAILDESPWVCHACALRVPVLLTCPPAIPCVFISLQSSIASPWMNPLLPLLMTRCFKVVCHARQPDVGFGVGASSKFGAFPYTVEGAA